jgi:hypothetical protein
LRRFFSSIQREKERERDIQRRGETNDVKIRENEKEKRRKKRGKEPISLSLSLPLSLSLFFVRAIMSINIEKHRVVKKVKPPRPPPREPVKVSNTTELQAMLIERLMERPVRLPLVL